MQNEVAVDQPKTGMKVAAETGEAAIDSVAAAEAPTAAEVAEIFMIETSSAVVIATTVAETMAAAAVAAAAVVVAAVQAG